MESRTKNSIRNVFFSVFGQFLGIVISLVSRIFFVKILLPEYLGLNGLFTNIISILTLTELGFSTAMAYELYKPLSEKNTELIKSLMYFYKKVYLIVGCVVLSLGVITLPFYKYMISEVPDIQNLDLIYMLFVINAAVSYFCSAKRLIIIADQKQYITTIYRYLFYFVLNIFQIIGLLLFKNYILYLVLQIIFNAAENLTVSHKANKMYPYLKDKHYDKISNESLNKIKYNVKALFFHRFGGVVLNSTDNIVISKFIGLIAVGIYSNYLLIITALQTVIRQLFNALVASIGNLNISNNKRKMTEIFDKMFFLDFWIHCVCTICLISLFNPFIKLWIGKNYLLDFSTVVLIGINFYLFGMRWAAMSFREATGNYDKDKISPLIEAVINICSSIILAKFLGVSGVVLGTIISCFCTCFWWEPLVVCKKSLNKTLKEYFLIYLKYTMTGVMIAVPIIYLCINIPEKGLLYFVLKIVISFGLSNVLLVLINRKNSYFLFYLNLFKDKISTILKLKKV